MAVITHHNFEDEALIKRWRACQKWMRRVGNLRTKINWVTIESYFRLMSKVVSIFEVWNSLKHEYGKCNREITKSSKGEGNAKKWTQIETLRRSEIVEFFF